MMRRTKKPAATAAGHRTRTVGDRSEKATLAFADVSCGPPSQRPASTPVCHARTAAAALAATGQQQHPTRRAVPAAGQQHSHQATCKDKQSRQHQVPGQPALAVCPGGERGVSRNEVLPARGQEPPEEPGRDAGTDDSCRPRPAPAGSPAGAPGLVGGADWLDGCRLGHEETLTNIGRHSAPTCLPAKGMSHPPGSPIVLY
jgi:hypothetical protein